MKHILYFIAGWLVPPMLLILPALAFADNAEPTISKDNLERIVVMKDDKIYFHLKDGDIYMGDPINPRHCPNKVRGKIKYKRSLDRSFRIEHNYGFTTCRYRIERIA